LAKKLPVVLEGKEVTVEKGVFFIEYRELYIKAVWMAKENIACLLVAGIRSPLSALNPRLQGLSG
jgi:uncharacterized protein YecA (UPF0149 family)